MGGAPGRPSRGAAGGLPVTVFRGRRWLLRIYLVLGVGLMVQGIATAAWFVLADDVEDVRIVAIGLALFLVWLGIWFGGYAWRRIRDGRDPIVIGSAGIHDRAVSDRPIAWNDIHDLRVTESSKGGRLVVFDLAPEAEERAAVRGRVRVAAAVNRRFGYGYRIHNMGTDATVDRLVTAIRPYADVRED